MMTKRDKIGVLVVEDSPSARELIVHILESDTRFTLLGAVPDGEEAIRFLKRVKPDVIVMDVHLPGMNGYEATRSIMETRPVPIVICSATFDPADAANSFRALDAGALAVVAKPTGPTSPHFLEQAARLIEAVALMSEVVVVKRWPRVSPDRPVVSVTPPTAPIKKSALPLSVVAIGTSTGGPPVLQTILSGLRPDFPLPILIVQHIAAGFLSGLVDWLTQTTGFPVKIGVHGETLLPGHAYLAPDGYHMGANAKRQIVLSRQEPENGLRPAVSYLFRAVGNVWGGRCVAILLTGMGRDGADELKALRDLGAITVAQDADSSVVHGMPGEAIKLGAAAYVLPPERIPLALLDWIGRARSSSSRTKI